MAVHMAAFFCGLEIEKYDDYIYKRGKFRSGDLY